VHDVAQRHGRINILVNLVGGFWGGKPVAKTDEKDWDFMLQLNLKSAFLCAKAVAPAMIKGGWGRIVSVSSHAGVMGYGDYAAYSVAKGAIITLTKALAEELLPYNITVNAIAPSTIDTEANRQAMPKADWTRWVKPEEIAKVLLFLCSDDAFRCTGGRDRVRLPIPVDDRAPAGRPHFLAADHRAQSVVHMADAEWVTAEPGVQGDAYDAPALRPLLIELERSDMWFGVSRLPSSSEPLDEQETRLFEERIVVVNAADEAEAWMKANEHDPSLEERDTNAEGRWVAWTFGRTVDVKTIPEDYIAVGIEVFNRFLRQDEVDSLTHSLTERSASSHDAR
jgi:Enoyl-(Acyl carrier protein) reductase/Domain of unknown function (DUF4288)